MADLAFQQQGGSGRRAPEGQREGQYAFLMPKNRWETAGNRWELQGAAGNSWKLLEAVSSSFG
eukprot:9485744-Alexandrium_andersonii.AAC.1